MMTRNKTTRQKRGRLTLLALVIYFLVECRVIAAYVPATIRKEGGGVLSSPAPVLLPLRRVCGYPTYLTMVHHKKSEGRIKAKTSRRAGALSASNATSLQASVDVMEAPTPSVNKTKDNLHTRFLSRLEEMHKRKNQGENLTQSYCDSVLALCVASDEWDSVLDVLEVMKSQGLSQERSTYRACFQACFEVGNGASAREILNAMRQALVRPDPVDISLVVAAMCRNEHTESGWSRKALNLLRSTAEEALQGDSPVPVEAYDAVLTSMKASQWKEALKLLREMEQGLVNPDETTFHPCPTVSTYRAVVENCVEARQTEAAVQILLGMPGKGITPTVYTFELVISALARKMQWRRALQLLDVMDQLDVPKTVVTYNTVISACARGREVGTAKHLLAKMRKNGVKPNIITFNSIISACASTSRWKDALKILDQCNREPAVQPDIITYTNAMRACARGGKTDRALTLLEVVKDKKLPLDNYCYTAVIDACAKAGLWRKALELLDEMEDNGVPPNEVSYSVCITACGNGGQWEKALQLLNLMKEKSMQTNLITYNAAITALSKASKRTAKFRDKQMATEQYALDATENNTASSTMGSSGIDDQLWEKALNLLDQMRADGIQPDGFSFSAAISCCGAGGRWEEALTLINTMKKGGPKTRPNRVSYTAAIAACGRAGQYQHALRLFTDMDSEGLQPDTVSWNALFSAFRVANQPEKAYTYWREMIGKAPHNTANKVKTRTSSSPDIVTITDVLAVLSRSGEAVNMKLADEVFQDAVERSILLSPNTLNLGDEIDLSGMAFPVARAACRYVLGKVRATALQGGDIKDVSFITGVGTATRARDFVEENVRRAKAAREVGKDPSDPTNRPLPMSQGTALREYVQQVLLEEFSVDSVVPKAAQGTVVVPALAIRGWVAGIERKDTHK